jgi:hypothetical protein
VLGADVGAAEATGLAQLICRRWADDDPRSPTTYEGGMRMKRYLLFGAVAAAVLAFPGAAAAQSGHFVGNQTCTDIGTQVQCSGKVAGLGGTTFTITVAATGTADVTCTNPAGNVAPGQSFDFDAAGASGPFSTPRNGQASYTVTTNAPSAPPGSCPNPRWTATVTDVAFTGNATLSLFEDSTLSDQVMVPIS